jgi:hypothetical protein
MLLLLFACAASKEAETPARCPAPVTLEAGCGDLDCDGAADLALAQTEDSAGAYDTRSALLRGPDWSPLASLPTLGADDVAIADLDGDDWPEVIFANLSDGAVRDVDSAVYWGGPEGFDEARRTLLPTVGAADVEVADVDLDGWPDLIFSNRYSGTGGISEESYHVDVTVYQGGPEGYGPDRVWTVPGFGTAQTAVGDFDQDGTIDLALAAGTFWATESWVYLGGPDGWTEANRQSLPTLAPEAVLQHDLDADGWLDLIYANFYDALDTDILSAVYWGGEGGFDPERRSDLPTHGADDLALADLDGDGCAELIIANAMEGGMTESDFEASSEVWSFGVGVREPTLRWSIPTVSAAAVSAGDLDGDGATDLAFAQRYDAAGAAAGATVAIWWGPTLTEVETVPAVGVAGLAMGLP